MRLHRLEVTAFGPFAETCVVDFDLLTDSGLFLVHGPTGAGKTSLLDAVCFALYAGVPGGRGAGPGAQLRSHHAAEGVAPSVVLELTAAGRRLRITRSPAWTKPSRANPVPAKVALEELRRGRWEPVSARADEVGDVVNDVMGMGRQQFERVVLLPQGDFAAFLRSSAEDRRKVLDRLFDVSTYGGVEAWLTDRRREGAAALAERRAQIGRLTAALAEVVAGLPEPLVDDLATMVGSADDPTVLTGVLPVLDARLDSAVTAALAEHDATEGASTVATEALEASRILQATRAKGRRAQVERAALADDEVGLGPQRLTVAEAERAAPLRGHLEAVARTTDEQCRAESTAELLLDQMSSAGMATAAGDGGRPAVGLLQTLHLAVTDHDRGADAVDTAREELRRLHRRAEEQRRVASDALSRAEAQSAVAHDAEAAMTALAERHQSLVTRAAGLDADRAAHAELTRRHRLMVAVRQGDVDLLAAADRVRDAVDSDQSAKDTVLALRSARLDDMAAELAGQLADGQPCAVCGSADHPQPATARHTVTVADVVEAERVSAGLSAARSQQEAALASLQGAQAERLTALGDQSRDEEATTTALAEAAERVAVARAAAREAESLEAELTTTRAALAAADAAHDECIVRVTAAEAALAELATQAAETLDRLVAAMSEHADGCPCATEGAMESARRVAHAAQAPDAAARSLTPDLDSSIAAVVERHRGVAALVGRVVEAVQAVDRRAADRQVADQALQRELAGAGFADATAATAALVDRDRLRALVDRLRQHDDAVVRVEATLEDPDIVTALAAAAPDLGALEMAAKQAREAARQALRRHTEARTALDAGRRLIDELTREVVAFGPAAERQVLLAEVADAAAGNGSNTLRMPLSSYVLAARLERVAELANERLAVMGEGRFELRHTDDRSGNAKSGLGLEVVDLWTGQPRPTSTLSGGESFMASLALALGLADAVREEAGGVDLQTLFVDEGFGTLDDESLEQVMSVLDTLRDGGRAVGVVSHVADLRTRIPRQVKVTKTPHGSSVTLVGADHSYVA